MCRFVLYMGPEISISSLVTEPKHSIMVQSYHSKERDEPLNGDGFGVGWYPPTKNAADNSEPPRPAVFKSVTPAWNNQNLLNLSPVIDSHCILAHVRAASPGLPVTQFNCHPFSWQQLTFMHNGGIDDFATLKRPLRNSLSDTSYNWIQGTTDSETIFALFIDNYAALQTEPSAEKLASALIKTITSIEALQKSSDSTAGCDLNLVVTDGHSAVVSRYSSQGRTANSLYINSSHRYSCDNGEVTLAPCDTAIVLVASEPLAKNSDWHCVDANHIVVINELLEVDIRPIGIQ